MFIRPGTALSPLPSQALVQISHMSERADKSSTRHATNIQHHRIELDDDFEVVQARTSSVTGRGQLVDSPRSPLKGRTTWTIGDSWAPEDDDSFDLDPNSDLYDEEVEVGLQRALPPEELQEEPPSKKRRTQASVSYDLSLSLLLSLHWLQNRLVPMFFGRRDTEMPISMNSCVQMGEGILCATLSAQTASLDAHPPLLRPNIDVRSASRQI